MVRKRKIERDAKQTEIKTTRHAQFQWLPLITPREVHRVAAFLRTFLHAAVETLVDNFIRLFI